MSKMKKSRTGSKDVSDNNAGAYLPMFSTFVNSWNQAAVHCSFENQKLPSQRTRQKLLIELKISDLNIPDLRLSTNDWNRKALSRMSASNTAVHKKL